MKQEEKQAKSQAKVKEITDLCQKLQIVISAEQMITEQGFIKQVVYYNDTEKYEIDKEISPEDESLFDSEVQENKK